MTQVFLNILETLLKHFQDSSFQMFPQYLGCSDEVNLTRAPHQPEAFSGLRLTLLTTLSLEVSSPPQMFTEPNY